MYAMAGLHFGQGSVWIGGEGDNRRKFYRPVRMDESCLSGQIFFID
jgi:hypothetical protein